MNRQDQPIDRIAAATELRLAHLEQRAPALAPDQLQTWVSAIDHLIRTGRIDAAAYGAHLFLAAHPDLEYAKTATVVLDRVPRRDDPQFRLNDDPGKDVQAVRTEGADTVAVFFCDKKRHLGLPLNAIHRWFAHLPASFIYLRDLRALMFLDGVDSLGKGRKATLASLRDLIASLGARRVVCFGNSSGGFAALQYGLDLGAEAVLAYAGFTNLASEFIAHHRSGDAVAACLKHASADDCLDLRAVYSTAKAPPRTRIVFGENNWDDRVHAEHLSGLPTVMLDPLPEFNGHDALIEAICRDLFPGHLDWLAGMALPWQD
jgi:hypothetical protein